VRRITDAILYVDRTGILWRYLPPANGLGPRVSLEGGIAK